jgi:hypothetical protein
MRRKIHGILGSLGLFWMLFFPVSLLAQSATEVGLRLDVDKRRVEVGESLTLTLEFKQVATGSSSVMQEPSIPTPENFQIRGNSSTTQITMMNGQTMQVSTTTFELVATKAGEATVGPALLIYQDDQGMRRQVKSNEIHVTVVEKTGFSLFGKKKAEPPVANPVPPAANTPDDLRAIKGLPPDFPWLKFLFWSVVLVLIIGFFVRQLRKWKRTPGKAVPPGKAAELRAAFKKLNDDLSAEQFCLGLSNLVRECLQYRYGFSAVDFTTEEILKELEKQKMSADERGGTEKCLKTCDRVLYADGNLTGRDALRTACSALLPKISKN